MFFFACELGRTILGNWFTNEIPVNQSLWEGVEGWNMLFQWLKEKDAINIWMIICW